MACSHGGSVIGQDLRACDRHKIGRSCAASVSSARDVLLTLAYTNHAYRVYIVRGCLSRASHCVPDVRIQLYPSPDAWTTAVGAPSSEPKDRRFFEDAASIENQLRSNIPRNDVLIEVYPTFADGTEYRCETNDFLPGNPLAYIKNWSELSGVK